MKLRYFQTQPWIGLWLMLVAALHTLVAALLFAPAWHFIFRHGVFNVAKHAPDLLTAVWFLLFGALLAVLGMAVHALEQTGSFSVAGTLGWATLALTLLGLLFMPLSGFWLALPAVFGLFYRAHQSELKEKIS